MEKKKRESVQASDQSSEAPSAPFKKRRTRKSVENRKEAKENKKVKKVKKIRVKKEKSSDRNNNNGSNDNNDNNDKKETKKTLRRKQHNADHSSATTTDKKVVVVGRKKSTSRCLDNGTVPDFLRAYITQEAWNKYSPIRRESFKHLMKNPNSFFYRNRPPGDPQKYGSFTPDEEKQFLERVRYFREDLKIKDNLWGLFSVPLKGRVGYQCSNFYRSLVIEQKINDPKYKRMEDGKLRFQHGSRKEFPEDSYRILMKEAFDYITECLKSENISPITIPDFHSITKGRRPANHSKNRHSIKTMDNLPEDLKINPIFHRFDIDEIEFSDDDKIITDASYHFMLHHRMKHLMYNSKNQTCKISNGNTTTIRSNITPIHYAPDPITNKPMENPYLDEFSGVVMDITSWALYFLNLADSPYEQIEAQCINDLIPINAQAYIQFKNMISNICV